MEIWTLRLKGNRIYKMKIVREEKNFLRIMWYYTNYLNFCSALLLLFSLLKSSLMIFFTMSESLKKKDSLKILPKKGV